MTRITPRTCLWPLAASLTVTFVLSIGLTFRSDHYCYAGVCGEWLFPLQARLHVIVWYTWLSTSVVFFSIRTFHPAVRKALSRPISQRKLPLLNKRVHISGLLLFLWVITLYGVVVGIWWTRLSEYFEERGIEGGILSGNGRLAAIALTGHWCDITMGMALIPISRHSALAAFFKISVSRTLTFHMLTAYTLFTLVLAHALLYVSWIPVWEMLTVDLQRVYPLLNPTYLYDEVWPGSTSSLGIWRASLIFSGAVTSLIFVLIFITTLPIIRNNHFNVFYFTHLLGIVAVIVICLHASTMFYCTSPALMMWLLDWGMRIFELRASLKGQIAHLGKGWYSLTVPISRHRLDGCACTSPLAHFYIYHSSSSIRELHPFTTTTHLASQKHITDPIDDDITIQFLFRKSPGSKTQAVVVLEKPTVLSVLKGVFKKQQPKNPRQWTDRIASLADNDVAPADLKELPSQAIESSGDPEKIGMAEIDLTASSTTRPIKSVDLRLRLEGPYFTPADPARYHTVICLVAGTGVSGAIAIANAFRELERKTADRSTEMQLESSPDSPGRLGTEEKTDNRRASWVDLKGHRVWMRCIVLWSVRAENHIALPDLNTTPGSALEVHTHITGNGQKRLDVTQAIGEILDTSAGQPSLSPGGINKTWTYISGPNAFITAGEEACKVHAGRGLEYYGARWDI